MPIYNMASPSSSAVPSRGAAGDATASKPKPTSTWLTRPGALVALVLGLLLGAPLLVDHIAPALTPESMPPKFLYDGIIGTVGYLDRVLSALTPPNLLIFRSAMGYLHTVQLYTVARLGIADAIGDAPMSSLAIAESITGGSCKKAEALSPQGCNAVASRVTRLLRATSTYGVFREVPAGAEVWQHTSQSKFIVKSHPASMHAVLLNFGDVQFRMMAELPATVVSGEAAFLRVHGNEFWSWYGEHPTDHAVFDATMQQLGRLGGADAAVARDVPWGSRVNVVVDVGGGHGLQAASILLAHPTLHGVVLDMPHVVSRAEQVWQHGAPASMPSASTVRSRISWLGGDMFDPSTLPGPVLQAQAQAKKEGRTVCTHEVKETYGYALRDILHDWPDEDCVRILSSLSAVMRGGATPTDTCWDTEGKAVTAQEAGKNKSKAVDRVFIIGRVIVPGASFVSSLGSQDADMVMLGAFGTTAGERTTAAYSALLQQSGLTLVKVHPTRSHYAVIEAVKA